MHTNQIGRIHCEHLHSAHFHPLIPLRTRCQRVCDLPLGDHDLDAWRAAICVLAHRWSPHPRWPAILHLRFPTFGAFESYVYPDGLWARIGCFFCQHQSPRQPMDYTKNNLKRKKKHIPLKKKVSSDEKKTESIWSYIRTAVRIISFAFIILSANLLFLLIRARILNVGWWLSCNMKQCHMGLEHMDMMCDLAHGITNLCRDQPCFDVAVQFWILFLRVHFGRRDRVCEAW